ncbi:MAG: ABC transporter ATP-binding protein [Candidatus Bipolaricaulota bacterium]|nr:ABC transporter ATP-binding protein [Candidatus Bipolaricaulota bacterium]
MDAIRTSALVKSYERGKVLALSSLDLHVPEGSVFGFLGPNGAGKTTAIKILTGLVEPTSGEAWVAGEPVVNSSSRLRSQIGYLSQDPRFYSWMTGRELLVFAGRLYGADRSSARRRADALLELSGLTRAATRRIGGYSGGMVQRLGIAQAVVSTPRILFLDEPCASLDPLGRHDVLEFIAQLRGKTTVLMSTHILEDVERVCDTVGIIDRGRMVATAETGELGRRFAPPVVELGFETAEAAAAFAAAWAETGSATEAAAAVEGETVELRARDLAQTRASALRLVAAKSLPLVRLETRSASLEDVFVRLVGGTS